MIDNSTKDKLENETPHFGNTLLYAVADLKRYSTIVVDPPWAYGIWGSGIRGWSKGTGRLRRL